MVASIQDSPCVLGWCAFLCLCLSVSLSVTLALALPSSSSSSLPWMVSYGDDDDDDVTAVLARSSGHTLIVREVDSGSSSQAVFLLLSSSFLPSHFVYQLSHFSQFWTWCQRQRHCCVWMEMRRLWQQRTGLACYNVIVASDSFRFSPLLFSSHLFTSLSSQGLQLTPDCRFWRQAQIVRLCPRLYCEANLCRRVVQWLRICFRFGQRDDCSYC